MRDAFLSGRIWAFPNLLIIYTQSSSLRNHTSE
uniref:Uncharacterized protein n=1 Tax=Arundo donax TaxID=35708 RepID=A0A0A9FYV9_ARUDO